MAPRMGFKHSAEAKEKIRQAVLRRNIERPDIVQRFRAGRKLPRSKETRLKYAIVQKQDYGFLAPITPTEWAYIAGLMDGEGWVGIVKRTARRSHILSMNIANTNQEVLDWLRGKLKGNLSVQQRPEKHKHYKPLGKWSATQTHAEAILRHILPFSIIKKRQMLLALRFQELRFNDDDEVLALKEEMRLLNKRGISITA